MDKKKVKKKWREVIMTPGEGSVPAEQIEVSVKKAIEMRKAGKTKKRKKKVKVRIVADKPKRKILKPNLVSKKEQKEIRETVKKTLEEYPFEQAMENANKKQSKPKKKAKPVENLFYEQIHESKELNMLGWNREFLGIPDRKFRFDFANVSNKVAVEIQGGVFIYGGHSTGMGITRDCEKLALAILNGWTLFMFTSGQVRSGQAIKWLQEYFEKRL